jgi:hypothetical protein
VTTETGANREPHKDRSTASTVDHEKVMPSEYRVICDWVTNHGYLNAPMSERARQLLHQLWAQRDEAAALRLLMESVEDERNQSRAGIEAARATLRNVLAAIDQSEQYERQALQIRDVLGLCQTTGCDNKRLESREADGYCQECLDG